MWAQALDNQSEDHFVLRGKRLDPGDPRGSEVIGLISNVIRNGRPQPAGSSTRCFMLDGEVVVEVSPSTRDVAGRISPVQAYILLPPLGDSEDSGWAGRTAETIGQFAEDVGRPLSAAQQAEAQSALGEAKKKRSAKLRGGKLLPTWVLLFLALFLAIAVLRTCGNEPTTNPDLGSESGNETSE